MSGAAQNGSHPAARFALAQFNVARIRHALDDARMAGFVEALEPINRLSDAAPGFVWRLKDASGNSTGVRPYPDARILVTLSLWRDLVSFEAFVYSGAHALVFARRHEWFEPMHEPALVLWWQPAGAIPAVEEAVRRLELLRARGPSAAAFTPTRPFGAP